MVAAIVLVLIWLALPYLATQLLTNQFASTGWLLHRLSLQRPTIARWRWPLLQFSSADQRTDVTASNMLLQTDLADSIGLELEVEQLTITLGVSEQRQVLDPAAWLSSFHRYLPLAPAKGQIDRLEFCPPGECFVFQLSWFRQSDGLVVTATMGESGIDQIHILIDEDELQLDIIHAGARPSFVTLRAGFEDDESIQVRGEMLLVRDAWFERLQRELALPPDLDLDWQTLSIRYAGDLLLDPVDTASMLLQNIRGEADLG